MQGRKRPRLDRHRVRLVEEDEDDDEAASSCPVRVGRCIYFYCDVTVANILVLARLLSEVVSEQREHFRRPRVYLFIHSSGGDALAGMSGMAHLKRFAGKVTTVVDGFCASAATLLLLGGERRYIIPYSTVLIHQLRTGFLGKHDELHDEYQNCTKLMSSLRSIYLEKTSITKEHLETLFKSELYLDHDECIKYGVVSKLF